ncbi:unnamed protein product (macronuclear) [Paramecium tetraurelia]|uniref:Uncharacterized protein n=1 Tax=Paramecium tetraurelia TaxID=5888 RepID=A0EFV9_PARTE|nr:uncharacterized protein GSPATT00026523001 [Paramecium tetraurelia]CAK94200.1 unnamed protein product [Paramecium tetraurelia]|eukprot:XP_001461573.1 hypothetical protein (macronuclear) [Paramecium tetraurelia strain d4-2]
MRQQQISAPTTQFGLRHSLQIQSSPNIKLYQQSPYHSPYQSPLLQQQSVSQQRQPIQQNNLGNVNRNLFNDASNKKCKLVDLNHIEEPWKQKVFELEKKIQQLKQQQKNQESDSDESELSQVYSQVQQFVNTIKILQEEIQNLQEKLNIKQNIIGGYDKQLIAKDKELEDQNHYIQELHSQLEEQTLRMDDKQKLLLEEINSWKRKFIEQNKGLHKIQDEQVVLQTQIDNLKTIKLMLNKQSEQT